MYVTARPPKEQNCNKDSSVSSQIHGEDFGRPMEQQQTNYQVLSNVLAAGRQDGHSALFSDKPIGYEAIKTFNTVSCVFLCSLTSTVIFGMFAVHITCVLFSGRIMSKPAM
jgi:hypothetical protein